jgi:hypothetical protein
MEVEVEIEREKTEIAKEGKRNQLLVVMKNLICKELLKNPKRQQREKREIELQQLRLQEQKMSLERERSQQQQAMISILEVKVLTEVMETLTI